MARGIAAEDLEDDEGWVEIADDSQASAGAPAEAAQTRTKDSGPPPNLSVTLRFDQRALSEAERMLMTYTKEQLKANNLGGRGSVPSNTKHVMKTLTMAMSLPSARTLAARELQGWITSPGTDASLILKVLKELGKHCRENTKVDRDVLVTMLRLKLPAKSTQPLIKPLAESIEVALGNNPQFPITALQYLVPAEIASSGHGLSIDKQHPLRRVAFELVLRIGGSRVSKILGCMMQDHLAEPRDPKAALRAIVIKNAANASFDIMEFAGGVLPIRSDGKFMNMAPPLRERFVHVTAELLALAVTVKSDQASQQEIKEAYEKHVDPTARKFSKRVIEFKRMVAKVQQQAILWLLNIVPGFLRSERHPKDLVKRILFQILYTSGAEPLFGAKEEVLSETDQLRFRLVYRDAIAAEGTLGAIVQMGLKAQHPLQRQDALAAAYDLVRRAAPLCHQGVSAVVFSEIDVLDGILDLSAYTPAIKLPQDYKPPSLAVSQQYYQAWIVLTILAACNPQTVGKIGWSRYPSLRVLMAMCITGETQQLQEKEGANASSVSVAQEVEHGHRAQADILGLEAHLAKACNQPPPTAATSRILDLLTAMNPRGLCRKLPQGCIDEMRRANGTAALGKLMCACREPDFLLDVMKLSGATQSMSWLVPLVESIPVTLSVLPTEILCELVLRPLLPGHQDNRRQCINLLRAKLAGSDRDIGAVMGAILPRLTDPAAAGRDKGYQACVTLFGAEEGRGGGWLTPAITALPGYVSVAATLIRYLLTALVLVTVAERVTEYSTFVVENTPDAMVTDALQRVGQAILTRPCVRRNLLGSPQLRNGMVRLFQRQLKRGGASGGPIENVSTQLMTKAGQRATTAWSSLQGLLFVLGALDQSDLSDASVSSTLALLTGDPVNRKAVTRSVSTSLELKRSLLRCQHRPLLETALSGADPTTLASALSRFGLPKSSVVYVLEQLDRRLKSGDSLPVLQPGKPAMLLQRFATWRSQGITQGAATEAALKKIAAQQSDDASRPTSAVPMALGDDDATSTAPSEPPAATAGNVAFSVLLSRIIANGPTAEADCGVALALARSGMLSNRGGSTAGRPAMVSSEVAAVQEALLSPSLNSEALGRSVGAHPSFWCTLLGLAHASSKAGAVVDMLRLTSVLLEASRSPIVTAGLLGMRGAGTDTEQALGRVSVLHLTDAADAAAVSTAMMTIAASRSPALSELSLGSYSSALRHCAATNPFLLESVVLHLTRRLLRDSAVAKESNDNAGDLIRRVVAEIVAVLPHVHGDGPSAGPAGLWLDWLIFLDPEMHIVPMLGTAGWRQLAADGGTTAPKLRCLLSAFLEHCDWDALLDHMATALAPSTVAVASPDSQVTLDFALSCLRLQRTWLGSRSIGKGKSGLVLSRPLAGSMAAHIIRVMDGQSVAAAGCERAAAIKVMQDRIAVLLHGLRSEDDVRFVVDVVRRRLRSAAPALAAGGQPGAFGRGSASQRHKALLLTQIYLLRPALSGHIGDPCNSLAAMELGSVLDPILQRTMTALLLGDQGSVVNARIIDKAYLLLRKLSLAHPLPVLKSVPTMASMLSSALSVEIAGLLDRDYQMVFRRAIMIWQSLRPIIFQPLAFAVLESCIAPTIRLFQLQENDWQGQLTAAVFDLFEFWAAYAAASFSAARSLLLPHRGIIQPAIVRISRGHMHGSAGDSRRAAMARLLLCLDVGGGGGGAVGAAGSPLANEVLELKLELRDGAGMSPAAVCHLQVPLQQLERMVYENPGILTTFADELLALVAVSDRAVRQTAYQLLQRLLDSTACNAGSRIAGQVLPVIVACLGSADAGVVESAVKHAPAIYMAASAGSGAMLLRSMVDAGRTGTEVQTEVQELVQHVLPVVV